MSSEKHSNCQRNNATTSQQKSIKIICESNQQTRQHSHVGTVPVAHEGDCAKLISHQRNIDKWSCSKEHLAAGLIIDRLVLPLWRGVQMKKICTKHKELCCPGKHIWNWACRELVWDFTVFSCLIASWSIPLGVQCFLLVPESRCALQHEAGWVCRSTALLGALQDCFCSAQSEHQDLDGVHSTWLRFWLRQNAVVCVPTVLAKRTQLPHDAKNWWNSSQTKTQSWNSQVHTRS